MSDYKTKNKFYTYGDQTRDAKWAVKPVFSKGKVGASAKAKWEKKLGLGNLQVTGEYDTRSGTGNVRAGWTLKW